MMGEGDDDQDSMMGQGDMYLCGTLVGRLCWLVHPVDFTLLLILAATANPDSQTDDRKFD